MPRSVSNVEICDYSPPLQRVLQDEEITCLQRRLLTFKLVC